MASSPARSPVEADPLGRARPRARRTAPAAAGVLDPRTRRTSSASRVGSTSSRHRVHLTTVTTVPSPGGGLAARTRRPAAGRRTARARGRRRWCSRRSAPGRRRRCRGPRRRRRPAPRAAGRCVTSSTSARAAAAVHQGVAGQLAGRGDQLGLVDQRELRGDGQRAHRLAHPDDVVVGRRSACGLAGLDRRRRSSRQPARSAASSSSSVVLVAASRGRGRASSAMPRSTSSAVRTPSQRQAQLDQRDRDGRAHADHDGLGVEHPRDGRDRGQHPADEASRRSPAR